MAVMYLACAEPSRQPRPPVAIRELSSQDWQLAEQAARGFVEALDRRDAATVIGLSVDSIVASSAADFAARHPVLIRTAARGEIARAGGAWQADTAIVDFTVPVRSMPAHCYSPGKSDQLQFHLRLINGQMKVYRLPGLIC